MENDFNRNKSVDTWKEDKTIVEKESIWVIVIV